MTQRLPDNVMWKFWKGAMKDQKVPIPLGVVGIGYYRSHAYKKDIWWPLAIWVDDIKDPLSPKYYQFGDAPPVLIETKEQEEEFDFRTFQYAQKTPISHADYLFWKQNREWPVAWGLHAPKKDHKPVMTDFAEATRGLDEPAPERGIGDNSGATEEEIEKLTAEAFKDQVNSVIALFDKDHATITSTDQGNIAQGLRTRLTALASQGEVEHKIEKKPHLDAGRAVDDKWNPTIKAARDKAASIQKAVSAFGAKEQRRLDDEHKAKVQADMAKGEVPVEKAPQVSFQGAGGRKSTMKEHVEIEIEDYDLIYPQFRTNPEVQRLLRSLVQKVWDNVKTEMKGAKYTKTMRAT